MKNIKGVVFDKDGTLFDFNAVWSVWCDRVLGELSGGDVSLEDELAVAIGYNKTERSFTSGSLIVSAAADDIAQALVKVAPGLSVESVNIAGSKHASGLPLAPVENLESVLHQLSTAGLKLGVATNDAEASAVTQLQESRVIEHFDLICGYDSGFGSKPGPGMLQAFCKEVSVSTDEIVMVGDSLHDINAGVAAGVGLTVGVLTGPAIKSELIDHAGVVMQDIGGLLELLL